MLKIKQIDHIVLRTNKLTSMIEFYCSVLNCSLERTLPARIGLSQLRAGNALIDLVDVAGELGQQGGAAPTSQDNNLDHFCLQLESISEQALLQHLAKHNIESSEFANRYGAQGFGRSIYIKDPQGNTIELKPDANLRC
jgi:catechol-2,3-dioxygenase